MTSALDRNFGAPSREGTILNRGASLWSATSTPTLGLNGTAAGSLQLRGLTSGGATITVPDVAGTVNFRLPPTNGTTNQVLITDGSGNTSWTTAGAGTVSSVGLSMPAIFSVSGSPVTGVGTLTATLANQSANTVWAGPTTGAAAAPAFRALVGADLPNPSASTLGGVQSFAAVSSQWIRQISTSGVPTASQPAFTDISGTLAPTQCPNPSATTIGCVQSLAFQASKWISSISTSGVPSATQPAFTDISGTVAPSQLPTLGNNSVLGNNSGSTAIPTGLTASNVLDMVGSTRGSILYRGASGWSILGPGTSGFVLSSNGPGADPSYISVGGTGTVQTLTAGTGISFSSGATCTTNCTVSLSSIADMRLLANISGGSAAPIANTMTAILDATLGSTQGNILYRGASNWTVLAPGTNGQVLTQGASTPSWASAGSVSTVSTAGILTGGPITTTGTLNVNASLTPQGRLTLATGTPVMATSVNGAATVYYTPYVGNLVPIYDGTNMVPTAISELSQATTDATKSPAAVAANKVYDVFVWSDGGTIRATRGPAWTNSTTRGYTLTRTNGIWLNTSSITNGPAALRGTYVGTIASNGSSVIDYTFGAASSGGTAAFFNVWNAYNRVTVGTSVGDTAAAHTYASATVRSWNGGSGMAINFVRGLDEDAVDINAQAQMITAAASNATAYLGVGLDSTTAFSVRSYQFAAGSNSTAGMPSIRTMWQAGIGQHTASLLEAGDGTNSNSWGGPNSAVGAQQNFLVGALRQ